MCVFVMEPFSKGSDTDVGAENEGVEPESAASADGWCLAAWFADNPSRQLEFYNNTQ